VSKRVKVLSIERGTRSDIRTAMGRAVSATICQVFKHKLECGHTALRESECKHILCKRCP
jgi:hypothetical protein